MNLFRRTLRLLFVLTGLLAGLVAVLAAYFARQIVSPPRLRLWVTPGELGMPYDNVQFPALDGIRLSGWFIPAPAHSRRKGATVIMVHGWPWNRLGTTAVSLLDKLTNSQSVELIRLAHALHQDGFNVLMFDLRNHGESAAAPPVTFGIEESKDLLGAAAFVKTRPEVDPQRIAAIGFSMGGNTVLYSLPQTREIQAAIAVQPTSVGVFAERYGRDNLGPLSFFILPLAEKLYQMQGGRPFHDIRPGSAAAHAGRVPVLYIQGSGDAWGSAADVAQMAAATPNPSGPLFVESTHRFDGYQYLLNNPQIATAFFEQHLPE
ncbi:MAG TPA: alpha/beta fold hydrolase [Chloroflexota bacterium]|nr:alpha/beta fold hydrolase [Chloroflexota bacterium]HUM68396.1 alpha/beta fold hydrolase [Chloroflexota bacterium]